MNDNAETERNDKSTDMRSIARFLFEVGCLKRVPRSGWWLIGIRNGESVAEHVFRTAILGFILAQIAKADPWRTALMCLVHDFGETRVGDQHAIARRYLSSHAPELQAANDAVSELPNEMRGVFSELLNEFEAAASLESRLARDADTLECALQACEYKSVGIQTAAEFAIASESRLNTSVARQLYQAIISTDPAEWRNHVFRSREE